MLKVRQIWVDIQRDSVCVILGGKHKAQPTKVSDSASSSDLNLGFRVLVTLCAQINVPIRILSVR